MNEPAILTSLLERQLMNGLSESFQQLIVENYVWRLQRVTNVEVEKSVNDWFWMRFWRPLEEYNRFHFLRQMKREIF